MAGQRMFVAVVPPDDVKEELSDFLEPRGGMPWIDPEQWHLTLAFLPSVHERDLDELIEALVRVAQRHEPFDLSLAGAGAFPDALSAKLLWMAPAADLGALASGVRNACNSAGATPDGQRFVGHLTIARLHRGMDARKWLQVLDTFRSDPWTVTEIELVASHLREGPSGRPRYETVASVALGTR
ncbi:RNA 2',3'-cyclic phosphodiesterase [Yimella sp. cx-51]|uniref:RNA 2',3'-cyclic phosphodiesterase n=1 Tax=Yimella sp. cx-51 TaxID=2770551 RepID=UPI00165DCFFA|nr:RNA 2',3'-cyclic phosphodiesterase [Yimella sp. cx-51]MBC9957909.1 RNA 2',3'-cyclic phosphodiesterase [Yimella sp. cx-51]QTH38044.1 RNA 2',3'-cyclic phosphodiesterase [Yimella sp. cx-51]